MAVSVRGVTTGYHKSAKQSLAWPAGSAPGDLAVLFLGEDANGKPNSKPSGAGWTVATSATTWTLWRARVTADLLASPVALTGHVAILVVLQAAGRGGNISKTAKVKVTTPYGGVLVFARNDTKTATLTPTGATKIAGDVVNAAWKKRRSAAWWLPQTQTGTKGLGASNAKLFVALEVLGPEAPLSPVVVAPSPGAEVAEGAMVPLQWQHRSQQGAGQDRYQVQRSTDAATWSTLQVNGSWSTADTWIDSPDAGRSVSLPAGAEVAYYRVRTAEVMPDQTLVSPWSASLTVDAVPAPSVIAVSVSSPAEILEPVVSWAASTAEGKTVTSARVRLLDAASSALVVDSGWMAYGSGDDPAWTAPATSPWTRGQSLKAEVTVRQSGGLVSAAVLSSAFAVTWTPPATPTVSVVPGVEAAASVASAAEVVTLQVQASWLVDGVWSDWWTVEVARTASPQHVPVGAVPFGRQWRVRARAGVLSGEVTLWSDWSAAVSAADVCADLRCLLVDGAGSVLAVHPQGETRQRVQTSTVTYGLGGGRARVDVSEPHGWAGTLTVIVDSYAECERVVAWLDSREEWWLRMVPEMATDSHVRVSADPLLVRWVPQVSPERLARAAIQARLLAITWVQADADQ